jgi:hypothetical protein
MTWEVGDLVYYSLGGYHEASEERKGFIVGQLNEEQITQAVGLGYKEIYMEQGTYLVEDFKSGLRGMARGDILKELK